MAGKGRAVDIASVSLGDLEPRVLPSALIRIGDVTRLAFSLRPVGARIHLGLVSLPVLSLGVTRGGTVERTRRSAPGVAYEAR